MKQKELIDHINPDAIVKAIGETEKRCSSEIRVHIEPKLRGRDILAVAERTFERLGMTRTKLRNGVLLFIAAEDQKFAILGDKGINDRVPPNFWNEVADHLSRQFKEQHFTEGILETIATVGSQLACYFPIQSGDINELTNEVSFGNATEAGPGDSQPGQQPRRET